MRVAVDRFELLHEPHCRRPQMNHFRAGLAVGQPQAPMVNIDPLSLEGEDLILATPSKNKQSDRGDRVGILDA